MPYIPFEEEEEDDIPFEDEPVIDIPEAVRARYQPRADDPAYVEFIMGPLRDSWRALGMKRAPFDLDEAASRFTVVGASGKREHAGYVGFTAYHTGRHRQWLLAHIEHAMAHGKQEQRDRAAGQDVLF